MTAVVKTQRVVVRMPELRRVVVSSPATRQVVSVGRQGPPGIPGSPGAGFVHSQPSAEAEWIVNHNLGVRPSVAVIDTGGNEIDAAVQHVSLNQLRIYFVTPTAGFARLT